MLPPSRTTPRSRRVAGPSGATNALTLTLALALAGTLAACGDSDTETSGAADRSSAGTSASASPSGATAASSAATSPTASGAAAGSAGQPIPLDAPIARAEGPCLVTAAGLDRVLAGGWKLVQQETDGCMFTSGRGAVIGTQVVGAEPADPPESLRVGLAVARRSCDEPIREVPAISGFVCVEHQDEGDRVVGNVLADTRLWVLVALPQSKGADHLPEVEAMTAVLGAFDPA